MTDFILTVANALKDTPSWIDSGIFPEGIKGRTVNCTDKEELETPEGGALLVITDSAELAKSVLANKDERTHIIYIGEYSEVKDIYDKLDAVWSAEEKELLADRTRKFVIKLKNEFDLWFYKNTLITTINTVPDMLWFKRLDGIHMLVNDAFTEIVHKPKSDIHGKDHFYIWDAPRPDPDSGEDFACAESEEIAISTGRTYICDEPVKTREGLKQFTTYKTPVYDEFGNVFGTVGVGHDVTNFSNLGIELSILIENMPFPMTIFTPDWKVVRMNSHFKEIVRADDIESFDYRAWKSSGPVRVGERREDANRHSATREYKIEVNGEQKFFMLTELEIRDFFDNVSGYFCTMQDITYQRAYEQSIIKAANTDMLTGMYNRRYFYDFLREITGKPFRLLYLDLDHFKAINDSFGHDVGDEVLIKTAQLIEEHFPDAVAARLGGDEFAIVDEKSSTEELQKRCKALEAAIYSAFEKYEKDTAMSIGIAETDGTTDDTDKLLHESDERMYEEKKRHHNR